MSVSHEDIMAEIRAMQAQMVVKNDLATIHADIAGIKATQEHTKEIVEALAFVKTGSKIVVWGSKFTAALLAVWVVFKSGAEFLLEIGRP